MDHFPVQLKLEVVPQHPGEFGSNAKNDPGKVIWSSLNENDLSRYKSVMNDLLDNVQIPPEVLHGVKICSCSSHHLVIEGYFQAIVDAVETADSVLPRKSPKGKGGRDFWTESLSHLKSDSIASSNEWQLAGRPSSGPIFERKKSHHYLYKAELRRQRRLCASRKSEALSQNLIDKDYHSFWKDWRKASQTNSPPVNRIGDAVSESGITDTFKLFFQQTFGVNDTDAHRNLRQQFEERFPGYIDAGINDSLSPHFISWDDMTSVVGKLKAGKSYNSFIKAEHLLYGSPKLYIHLHLLFNAFLQHGYVPSQFLLGTITPVVKDTSGDINSVNNYRGITLCGLFSHMFEHALRFKFGHHLVSDDLQFGFKAKHSTSHAVYALKTTINHFTDRGSNVYVALLDYSKAFDTISHSGLFLNLMDRKVPLCFLLVIVFWYANMHYNCRWGNSCSNSFPVRCGTKQGGILSPDFFSIYIDPLIRLLRNMKIGCHIVNLFIACLLFADDMTLLAPTRDSMQQLLNACADYCETFCLKFNISKTKVMVFGKSSADTGSLARISLCGEPIDFACSARYLGFHIESGRKFKITVRKDLCGFFGSVNSILSSMMRPNEHVQIQLLYSNCVPKLTYGAAVKDLSASEKQQLNVAVNNAVRRIFGFRRWESIRQLREFYDFKSIEILFAKAKSCFESTLIDHRNTVLRFLSDFTNPIQVV